MTILDVLIIYVVGVIISYVVIGINNVLTNSDYKIPTTECFHSCLFLCLYIIMFICLLINQIKIDSKKLEADYVIIKIIHLFKGII